MVSRAPGRRLDPLEELPCAEKFLKPTAGGPELARDVLHRVNGAVRALRSLYSGSVEDVLNVPSAAAVRREWRESTPMQRALVHRIWNRVATWSARLPLVDGRQVLDQITRSVPEA